MAVAAQSTPVQVKAVSANAVPSTDTFAVIQRLIVETTGLDMEEITLDSDLEEDLGIDMMGEFPLIVSKLKKEMPDVLLPTQALMECATVAELVELIDEERDL